jgi:hypothetical protein
MRPTEMAQKLSGDSPHFEAHASSAIENAVNHRIFV